MNTAETQLSPGLLGRPLELLRVCIDECVLLEERGVAVPHELFSLLMPTSAFRTVIPSVYRSHVRELLERFEARGDLSLGTAAESLFAMVASSLAAPPTPGYLALYWKLAADVLGESTALSVYGARLAREEWPGQLAELEQKVRRSVRSGRPKRIGAAS